MHVKAYLALRHAKVDLSRLEDGASRKVLLSAAASDRERTDLVRKCLVVVERGACPLGVGCLGAPFVLAADTVWPGQPRKHGLIFFAPNAINEVPAYALIAGQVFREAGQGSYQEGLIVRMGVRLIGSIA